MGLLTDAEIATALRDLPGWSSHGDSLTKTYEFADFVAAIGFMSALAASIDALDHHPEWTNVYNRVEVRLSSHDVGGITERDVRLAHVFEEAAS